ncbi:MAG: alpha/beta fold hydrolase [Blastomonas sp.]
MFIPSPINAPVVLDMDAGGSLLDWLDARGHAPLLLDWGRTTPSQRDENIDEYVTRYAVPLLQSCQEPVHLVGYCLGGVIAMAAACLTQVKSLTLIASPWNFSAYSAQRRAELAELWEGSKTICAHMGVVPMELVQQGFWSLSRSRLVQKYLDLADMDMDSDAFRKFVAIEDWANGGEPLPYAMGKQLFEQFYALDRPGRNEWRIGDTLISPDTLACPAYEIASSTDEIVPLACSPALKSREVLTQGHVGMVVGNSAPQRLWQSLDSWFASVESD